MHGVCSTYVLQVPDVVTRDPAKNDCSMPMPWPANCVNVYVRIPTDAIAALVPAFLFSLRLLQVKTTKSAQQSFATIILSYEIQSWSIVASMDVKEAKGKAREEERSSR
jgi:hypothetical protein